MDFLSGLTKSKPAADEPSHADQAPEKHSNADLLANAKVVAEAAQAQFGNEPEKCDKGKAAHAAADLLDAAEAYAKLDESKGVGKYVEQAEGYLRKYDAPAAGDGKAAVTEAAPAAVDKPSEGGAGDNVKKAEELISKPSGDGAEKSEGGSGDLLKAAGSFFK